MKDLAENRAEERKNGQQEKIPHPSFAQAVRFWLKLGFINFGGPTGQIAIMHQELVEKRRWVSEGRFLNALNYCMLLPGPEAQQLAAYIGWLLHGIRGGIIAGSFFIIPSMFILFGLSYLYVLHGNVPGIAAIFAGLKPAVMAVVLAAVIRIGKKTLKNPIMFSLAALSFAGIFLLKLPFPAIVLGAGLVGLLGGILLPTRFQIMRQHTAVDSEQGVVQICQDPLACHINPSRNRGLLLLVSFGALWALPMLILAKLESMPVLKDVGLFFTQAAFLTFGGAYAVLAYLAQKAVEHYGWLTGLQMMDGLGLAETTPGPLIMVVQFVGFLAGWNMPGSFSPVAAAVFSSLAATYFTFLPSFFFIFMGAPYMERLRGNPRLTSILSSITAAVVGVVLNLAVWFGMHVLLPPEGGLNWFGTVVGLATFLAIQWAGLGIVMAILCSGGLGLAAYLTGVISI
ncbi:MAG: chromate efflux transporter [bacterium]